MDMIEVTPIAIHRPPPPVTAQDNIVIVQGYVRRAERAALSALLALPLTERQDALRMIAATMHTPTDALRARIWAIASPNQRAALSTDPKKDPTE